MNERELQELISDLQHGDAQHRRAASYKLGKSKNPAAVPVLIQAYNDADSSVRQNVIVGLRNISSPEALDFLSSPSTTPNQTLPQTAQPKVEYICNVCNKKEVNGENGIVITGDKVEERGGGIKHIQFSNFHRMRIFVCAECRKEKGSVEKAIVNKAGEFGRTGEFSYWDNSVFEYSQLSHGDKPYLIIKDLMKDELYDNIENRTVQLIINIPGHSIAYKQGVKIIVDGIIAALFFISKEPSQISFSVPPGRHVLNIGKTYIFSTESNKTYEFDIKFDRLMGGWKITPRVP
jgi:hypothetical protein